MSNPHLAAASCALGMLAYAGVASLVPDAGAASRRAAAGTAPVTLRIVPGEQAADFALEPKNGSVCVR